MDGIAVRIKEERLRLGWTAKALAERANIDPSAISRLEKEQRRPTMDVAVALARAMGVTLDWLVLGRGPKRLSPRSYTDPEPQGIEETIILQNIQKIAEGTRFVVAEISGREEERAEEAELLSLWTALPLWARETHLEEFRHIRELARKGGSDAESV